jgi:hypothetical protein
MPVMNPFGVVAGTLSAGTTRATLGEVVFSNSNGVSFGINGQTITASVAAGGGGNTGSISAGTTEATLGQVVFSNSNGMSFGVNGQTITGSYTVPSTAGLLSNINVSGGTTSNNLSNVVFSNVNNVSFGLNGSTITASASVATSLTAINVSAGTTSNNLSAVTFDNANGLAFGLNGSVITGSYTVPFVPPITNSSWTVSDNANSGTVGQLAFTNLNGVTLSLSSGIGGSHTIVGSIATSLTAINISAGTTSNNLSAITFSNLNGVTFGLNGSVITASVAAGGGLTNINVSAGTTSNNLSAITLSNSNNVSFGLNGSVVTATATWPIATQVYDVGSAGSTGVVTRYSPEDHVHAGIVRNGVSNVGNTLGNTGASHGQFMFAASGNITASMSTGAGGTHTIWYSVPAMTNSSWTVSDAASSATVARLAFTNLNGVTLSLSTGAAGSHTIVGSVATSLTNIRVSAGTTSNNLSAITFSNGSNVSFGLNDSVITASVNTSLTNINVSAGTTSNNLSAITFSNGSNVSFGLNGSVVTASVNTSLTAINVSAGTTSNNLSAITFSNLNGLTFGLNGSVITGSYTVPGTLSVFAQSNTTQSSSGTIAFNSLQFNGAGIASVGISNGSVVISVPAGGGAGDGGVFAGVSTFGNTAGSTGTVSTGNFVLVGSNGISLSQSTGAVGSNATVTIHAPVLSVFQRANIITAAGSLQANSSASIIPFILDWQVSASQVRFAISVSAQTQTVTSSAGFAVGWSGVIYSNNAGTLSSINSFSNSTTTFFQSNSTSSVQNGRMLTANLATASLFSPGRYWMILNLTTTTSGQLSRSVSISLGVVPTWATGFGAVNYFGSNTTNTRGVQQGLAIHSTGATRASLVFTDITGHSGNSASLANVWFELNNQTIW